MVTTTESEFDHEFIVLINVDPSTQLVDTVYS